jgi:hypothetical protein
MTFVLRKAERRKAKARIALTGPSGSGKTMSALLLARGMAQELGLSGESAIGLIDSERGSAELYAHVVPFTVLDLTPPYSPARYMEALALLERHGCPIIIIDQISHAWAGEGGLLERVDGWKAGAKNAMAAWTQATPEQQRFVDALLRSPAHIIATMRVKSEWIIEEEVGRDGRKRQVPRKIGMAPVQRDGIEYEFTAVLDIENVGHAATASKDRTGLFDEKRTVITEGTGRVLVRWLNEGGPERFEEAAQQQLAAKIEAQRPLVEQAVSAHRKAEKARAEDPPTDGFGEGPPDQGALVTDGQVRSFWARLRPRAKELGVDSEAMARSVLAEFALTSSKAIPAAVFAEVIDAVYEWAPPKENQCAECKRSPCAEYCSLQGEQAPAVQS